MSTEAQATQSATPAPTENTPAVQTQAAAPTENTPAVQTQEPTLDQSVANPLAKTEGEQTPTIYTPSLKFKVMDQEKEFDPFIKDVIKDADTEKKVRELYEKAHGLEFVKERALELRGKHETLKKEHDEILTGLQTLRTHYQRGDFESFFAALKIPEQKILQWVINKAEYNQLPPEQRKVLDDKRSAEQRAYALEQQNQELQHGYLDRAAEAKEIAMKFELGRPEVQSFAEKFDAVKGKNAFWNKVIDYGEYAWSKGQDVHPADAIKAVMDDYAALMAQQQQVAPAAPVQQQLVPPQAPQKPKPLPNIEARSTSPVSKPKFKSLDDLKEYNKKKYGT